MARSKFRRAVEAAGGVSTHYRHPSVMGVLAEELTIDVGHVGNLLGSRQLIMISGTHGLEGFAGSALQIAWLRQLNVASLDADVGVLLIHGLNPFGFSHGSRTTANGVDLNRNFINHAVPPVTNPNYAALHPYLAPQQWDSHAQSTCNAAIAAFRLRHGDDAYFNAFAGGQYRYPEGVCFGGFAPEWENLTLQNIVCASVGHAELVAVIDWHTGIGEYGQPFHLNFGEVGSEAQRQAAVWWGLGNMNDSRPHGRARPAYQGLVFQGIASFLPRCIVAGGVIEFGTRGPIAGDLAIRQDLWLRNYGHLVTEDTRTQLHADLLDSLSPISYQWRDQVLENGLPIIDATVNGLVRW
ncbi:DUF2817 domain-containing protein [Pseudomonas moorei]|nr:DUF2817 domain-containing protein [Pseudomonas moorei]